MNCQTWEALEAIGRGEEANAHRFRAYLEHQYPRVRLDWKRLTRQIEEHLDVLPDEYPYREKRLYDRFRTDLVAFARQLFATDPQSLHSAAEVIREHRHALEYLSDLIGWRLALCEKEPNEWRADNAFYWRYELQGQGAPPEAWEHVSGFYERGDLDRAEAAFRLLLDGYPEDADIHNHLGSIALDRGKVEAAIEHFSTAVREGRRLFPRRIAKKRLWSDHDTRPFIRGLRNLALALNLAGKYEEALGVCERLENEADDVSAAAHRAEALLNLGRWDEAARHALRVNKLWPGHSFVAAFALFETGDRPSSLAWFLHGALNHPRTARMLTRKRVPRQPEGYEEVQDHNHGVGTVQALAAYVGRGSRRSMGFFREVMDWPQVEAMLDEVEHVVRRRGRQHRKGQREAFDRMCQMKSVEYAWERARELAARIEDVDRIRKGRA